MEPPVMLLLLLQRAPPLLLLLLGAFLEESLLLLLLQLLQPTVAVAPALLLPRLLLPLDAALLASWSLGTLLPGM